jgi:hypothetical protein
MNVNKAVKEINNALTNTVVEIYGDSGSGKSFIADKVAETKEFTLLIDSLMQRTQGSCYIVQTNDLMAVEDLVSEFDLIIIDDFFQLKGEPRDNIYKLQEWVYNNKKLSIILINQIRANFNERRPEKFVPYADYLLQRYADKRFYTEFKDGEYVVTQVK